MLTELHRRKSLQLMLGLVTGVAFGFLLQKGGATRYEVILGQLLLTDFTVVKIMLSAMVTGMLGIHAMKALGWVRLNPKPGGVGTSVIGGMLFGVGFATLGYCPGTLAAAIGSGHLDALLGGLAGILIGVALFAQVFPKLERSILSWGSFGTVTIPELLKVNAWFIVVPVAALVILLLYWLG